MTGQSFDDLLVVNPAGVRPVAAEEVAQLEEELGVRLPDGYADFVQRLGAGSLGHLVRVHTPDRLLELTLQWRERAREFWFWETEDVGVDEEALKEQGVLVADTFDGDELVLDPADPEHLVLLTRDDEARLLGPGLLAALDHVLSGALNPWTEGWTFEADHDRVEVRESVEGRSRSAAAGAVAALGAHAHVVELEARTTFFLPEIGARLSLHEQERRTLGVDLTHDGSADGEVTGLLAAVRGT